MAKSTNRKEPNNWKKDSVKQFKARVAKACEEIANSDKAFSKYDIVYIPIEAVIAKVMGKLTLSWRRDLAQSDEIVHKWEKLQILEEVQQSNIVALTNYAINNNNWVAGQLARQILGMRETHTDYNLTSSEEVANKIELKIEPTGKLKPHDDK